LEISGLVKVVISIAGATKVRYRAIEQLVVSIRLRVSKVITIVGRVGKNFKGAK